MTLHVNFNENITFNTIVIFVDFLKTYDFYFWKSYNTDSLIKKVINNFIKYFEYENHICY